MIKAACSKAHPFDLILTREQSRFGRSVDDASIRQRLREHGVSVDNITAPSGDMDEALTPHGEFNEAIQSAVDILDRKSKAKLMRDGQKAKARKGGLAGAQATCYGYKQDWISVNGSKPVRQPTIDKPKAKIVREMFRRYLKGDSLLGITRWLNESGIAAPRGKQWYESTVRKLMSNETLLGRLVYGRVKKAKHPVTRTLINVKNDGEVIRVDGAFPAIIDQQTFDRVQAIIGSNESTRPQGGHPGNTLRGIGRCAVCGWHLARQAHSQTGKWYYMCGHVKTKKAKNSDPGCKGILGSDYVDEVVALFLESILSTKITDLREQVKRYNEAATDLTGLKATEMLDLAIVESEKTVSNLVSAVAKKGDSPALLKALEEAETKLIDVKRKRETIAAAIHTPTVDVDEVLKARSGVKDALRKGDVSQMRTLLAAIVSEVRCDWSLREQADMQFAYHYYDKQAPHHSMNIEKAKAWMTTHPNESFRIFITPKGAPLMFITKWDILSAEKVAEEAISQIAKALAEPS
jgi:site-specific DNA recombinase